VHAVQNRLDRRGAGVPASTVVRRRGGPRTGTRWPRSWCRRCWTASWRSWAVTPRVPAWLPARGS